MKDINNEIELEYYCDSHRHLVCIPYNTENLHIMARDLGIKRVWFHNKRRGHHYDIPKRMYKEVLARCNLVTSQAIWHIIEGDFIIKLNN